MKTIIKLLLLLSIISSSNCSSDDSADVTTAKFTINAGEDITLTAPSSNAVLSSSFTGDASVTFNWSKISGPLSCTIENKNAPITNLSALETGIYIFEITASSTENNKTVTAKDQVLVTVKPNKLNRSTNNEIILYDFQWDRNDWYIEVPNIWLLFNENTQFKVYLKVKSETPWFEISKYNPSIISDYRFETTILPNNPDSNGYGSLMIYYLGNDNYPSYDSPIVKIVY